MPWGIIASVAAPVIGGLIGGEASKDAAQTQADASRYAAELANQRYQQTRTDLMPYMQQGPVALSNLQQLMGFSPQIYQAAQAAAPAAAGATGGVPLSGMGTWSRDQMMQALQANPAYQFNLSQGMDAINKASAARGMYYAPSTLNELGNFAQGMASNEYGNIWNRLFNMAGMGQNAATQTGQFGASAATNMGNAAMSGANAQAAGIMGQAGAYQQMIGGIGGALQNPATAGWLNSLFYSGSPSMGGYSSYGGYGSDVYVP